MGKGGQKSETSKQAPTRKTKAAVDRHQNNRMLLRQCPSGITQQLPYHATAVPTAMQNSQKGNVRSSAAGKLTVILKELTVQPVGSEELGQPH